MKIIGYKLNGVVSKEIADRTLQWKSLDYDGLYFIEGHLGGSMVAEAKRLDILDKWFTPVYEPEYKAGDWVVMINPEKSKYCENVKANGIYKVLGIKDNRLRLFVHSNMTEKDNNCYFSFGSVRLATPEEIKSVNVVEINGYKMKQSGSRISFGCAHFSVYQFDNIIHFNKQAGHAEEGEKLNRKVKSITLDSGVTLTIEQIKKIIEHCK